MAHLAGGAKALAKRATDLVAEGDLRLACHIAEMAGLAAPDDIEVHGARAEVYAARRKAEASLMSKGIFGFAERQSLQIVSEHNQKKN